MVAVPEKPLNEAIGRAPVIISANGLPPSSKLDCRYVFQVIAYDAENRHTGVNSTRHHGWLMRSPMVSSVITVACAGMCAAA